MSSRLRFGAPVACLLATMAAACSSTDAVDAVAPDDDAGAQDGASEWDGGGIETGIDSSDDAQADALDRDSEADSAGLEAGGDAGELDAGPDPCGEVNTFAPMFSGAVATWTAQDNLGGWPASPLVVTGSSSIRRWEAMAQAYTDYSPLQRGMGGAQLAEIALYADELVIRHDPRAVVVYAGTNDIAAGVPAAVVVDRLRCLRFRIGQQLGWTRPVLFVGITPNPSRWSQWQASSEVNAAVAALAANDPGLTYVDVATPFLATGSPPDASLFVSDGLHLSESGYELWNSAIRPAVEAVANPTGHAGTPSPALPSGTRILVDLGPSNVDDGEWTPTPDYLGQSWNNWHAVEGGIDILPGEQRVGLITSQGDPSGVDLVISGGFQSNGRSNGGLLWPDAALLGDLAVGSATGDFFYTTGDDIPGGLFLRGLDPSRTYGLKLFAARDEAEVRITRYTVHGVDSITATLQTSGPGAGQGGKTTNDDDIVEFTGLEPDPWGHLFIDVSIEQGAYGYLSLMELTVE